MEEKQVIEAVLKQVQQMYSKDGYFKRFEQLCQEYPYNTYKANFHLLEMEFFELFAANRYDYNTFRNLKSQRQNKLLTKVTPILNK